MDRAVQGYKQIEGAWFPEGDQHFAGVIRGGPRVKGMPTYQYKKYLAARGYVQKFDVVVDIGAHVGLWTNVMAQDFRHVVAFEPLARHRYCWTRNVGHLENAELYPYALSDEPGQLSIYMPPDNTGHAHVRQDGEQVPAIMLDSFSIRDPIGLIKIDVEGFELQVVRGAEQKIRKHKPVVIVEQKVGNAEVQGSQRWAARDLLLSWGMVEKQVLAGDHILAWR